MRSPSVGVALAVLLLGATAAGCGSSSDTSSGAAEIVYSPPVPGALPFLPAEVALAKGYFKDEGLTVTKKTTSVAGMPAALSSGQVDLSADVVYNSARYLQSGLEVKYVAGLNDNVDFKLLRANGVSIPAPGPGTDGWKKSFAALKDMKIGVAGKAGPIGLTTAALLKEAGVPAAKYTLVDTPGPVAVNALKSNQVQAVVSGGGFDAPIVENKLATQVLDFGTDISSIFGKQSNAALFMSDKAIKKVPGAPEKVQKAVRKADDYIADPANAADVSKIAIASGTVKTAGLDKTIANYSYNADMDVPGIEAAFAWAKRAGIISTSVDAASTIATGVQTR